MAKPGLAGVHDLFQFGDQRGRRPIVYRIYADGLTPQPIDVKGANSVERRLALAAGAENQQDLAAGVRSDRSWLRFKALH